MKRVLRDFSLFKLSGSIGSKSLISMVFLLVLLLGVCLATEEARGQSGIPYVSNQPRQRSNQRATDPDRGVDHLQRANATRLQHYKQLGELGRIRVSGTFSDSKTDI